MRKVARNEKSCSKYEKLPKKLPRNWWKALTGEREKESAPGMNGDELKLSPKSHAPYCPVIDQPASGVRRQWREIESGKKMRKKGRGERSSREEDAYESCFERLIPPLLSACNPTFWFWLFFGHLIKLGLGTGFNLVPRLAQIGKTWTRFLKGRLALIQD